MALIATPIGDTGFSWVAVSVDIMTSVKPDQITPITDDNHVIVVCETERLGAHNLLRDLEHNPYGIRYRLGSLGFIPVDVEQMFPGKTVRIIGDVHDNFDFDAWAKSMVDVPADLDVTFYRDKYGNKGCCVIARTLKKGKLTNVRASIDSGSLFVPAVNKILEKLRKTAPAPVVDLLADPLPDYTCGEHVSRLMCMLDATAHQMIEKWMANDLEQRNKTNQSNSYHYQGTSVTIPGSFLIGAKIDKMKLMTTHKSNAIHAELTLRGDHIIIDDETGTTVALNAQLPEAIVTAMRKRSLGDIIDADWAKPMTVRTAPNQIVGKIHFRAFSENVPFKLGDPVKVDDTEVERRINRAFVNGQKHPDGSHLPIWNEIETSLIPVLKNMDRRDLAIALARLEMFNQENLEEYGLTGWVIKSQGKRISILEQPAVSIEELGLVEIKQEKEAA